MTRHTRQFLPLLLGLALLLSACGSGSKPSPASTTWDSAIWDSATWQ